MSGIVRHRKQWKLQGGTRGPLLRLRSQLAEDGCSESQVILAKNLLQESESSIGSFESSEIAIHWLIQASDQANQEATNLLKSCLRHGQGITDRNIRQVEECINRSQEEKQYRKAAHVLFCNLTASTGIDYVTVSQLKNEVIKLNRGVVGENVANNHIVHNEQDEYGLILRDLQKIASAIYKGQSPKLYLRSKSHSDLSENLQQFHPYKVIRNSFDKLLELSAKQGQSVFINWFLPSKQFHVIGLLLLCSMVTTHTLLQLLPVLLCYISMFMMIISTFQMFHSYQGLIDLKIWTNILNHYNPVINFDDPESKYCWNNFSPYIQFLVSLIISVLVLPITSYPWILYSEFTVASICMTICTFIHLNSNHEKLTLLSIGCSIISSIPQLLSSTNLPSYFALLLHQAHLVKIYLGYGVQLNISIFSLFYVIVLICCVKLAWKNPFSSLYKVLIPHLVCLMWWQLTVTFFSYTTIVGIGRATIMWFLTFLSVRLFGWLLTSFIIAAICVTLFVSKESYVKLLIIILMIITPVLLSWWANVRKSNKLLIFAQRFRYIYILIVFGSILNPLFNSVKLLPSHSDGIIDVADVSHPHWNDYYDKCHKPAWQRSTMANVEVICSPLLNTMIQWEGLITLIRVINIKNPMSEFINLLPSFASSWFKCLYGEKMVNVEIQELFSQSNLRCHLQKWNMYNFEIVLRMNANKAEPAVDIFVDVDNFFLDYVLKLRRGDIIAVKGILSSDIGGSRPRIRLVECECVKCFDKDLDSKLMASVTIHVSNKLLAAAQSCFEFFFSPLLNYHPVIPSFTL